jgi:hypothetical protein
MTLPPVPEPFYWTQISWGAALRCRALDPVATHAYTTRTPALSDAGDWQRLGDAIGAARVLTLTQVHGCATVTVRRGEPSPPDGAQADVIVSDDPDVAVGVRAADCVPLLIADPGTGAVGAVHAGWRGTAAGAAREAVEALTREFGARPEDLVAVLGPSIGPCCYEVGSELVDAFAAAGHARHLVERWFQSPPPRRGSLERSTLRLDVPGANRDQLMLAGPEERNIHTAGLCTAMHLEVLTSYRAEGTRAGRLGAVIRAIR